MKLPEMSVYSNSTFQFTSSNILRLYLNWRKFAWVDKNNGDLNHMKDITNIQDTQPLLFNHVSQRGVAAKAESVLSMDRKLGREPTIPPPCASRTPVLDQAPPEVHRKSTGSPQTIPQKPHSIHGAKMHTRAHG